MRPTILSFFLLFSLYSFAQDEIFLENPSFEDFPKLGQTPKRWHNCGFSGESEVDIHPVDNGEFQVETCAVDSQTYLGMVTRDNDTWEAVGQRLSDSLKRGKTYSFNIFLAKSNSYLSASALDFSRDLDRIHYINPIILKIWGGDGYCRKLELLAESPLITNTNWLNFNFNIKPETDIKYITFEAFYQTPILFPYCGNILLDGASSFTEIIINDTKKAQPPKGD